MGEYRNRSLESSARHHARRLAPNDPSHRCRPRHHPVLSHPHATIAVMALQLRVFSLSPERAFAAPKWATGCRMETRSGHAGGERAGVRGAIDEGPPLACDRSLAGEFLAARVESACQRTVGPEKTA